MSGRSPFWRYLGFQVPGWLVAAGTAWCLYDVFALAGWIAAAIPGSWLIKDLALYPWLRAAYALDETTPVERLIGARGRPIEPLAPAGYVKIGGELWRAETDGAPIEPPADVVVVGAHGLLLRVRPARHHG